MSGWSDWIFGNLPLQPVLGDQIDPAYQQMPSSKNVDDRRAAAGPAQWASRPHDQDFQSYNMSGYYMPFNLDAIDWQRKTGFFNQKLPTTPMSDPNYIPTDPSIVARIKAAQDARDVTSDGAQPPIGAQQILNALQYWGGWQ